MSPERLEMYMHDVELCMQSTYNRQYCTGSRGDGAAGRWRGFGVVFRITLRSERSGAAGGPGGASRVEAAVAFAPLGYFARLVGEKTSVILLICQRGSSLLGAAGGGCRSFCRFRSVSPPQGPHCPLSPLSAAVGRSPDPFAAAIAGARRLIRVARGGFLAAQPPLRAVVLALVSRHSVP